MGVDYTSTPYFGTIHDRWEVARRCPHFAKLREDNHELEKELTDILCTHLGTTRLSVILHVSDGYDDVANFIVIQPSIIQDEDSLMKTIGCSGARIENECYSMDDYQVRLELLKQHKADIAKANQFLGFPDAPIGVWNASIIC